MNELITLNHANTFANAELEAATMKIVGYANEMSKNLRNIAETLHEVSAKELYKEDNFQSAADYAMTTFGFKKTFAYDLLSIGKRFMAERETPLIPENVEFSMSQFKEMLTMKDEDITSAIESGEITPDMTTKEIREVANSKKDVKTRERKEKVYIWELVGTDTIQTARTSVMENMLSENWVWYQTVKNDGDVYLVGVSSTIPMMWKRCGEAEEKKPITAKVEDVEAVAEGVEDNTEATEEVTE